MFIFGGVGKFFTNEIIIFSLEELKWERVILIDDTQPPVKK
jgi:hypothetical protein